MHRSDTVQVVSLDFSVQAAVVDRRGGVDRVGIMTTYVFAVDGTAFRVSEHRLAEISRYVWYAEWHEKVRSSRAFTLVDKRKIYLHRMITNAQPGQEVDHIDHDMTNNEDANLRLCTHAENVANARKRRNTTSRFKGVYWEKERQKWVAGIRLEDNKWHKLGRFDNEEDAARAYQRAAQERWGEFAYTPGLV